MPDLEPLLAVREYVTALVESERAWCEAQENEEARLKAEGYRLVSGGGDQDGDWAIIDYYTREVIAHGSGGFEEYDEATARLSEEGPPLWHVDNLLMMDWPDPPVPAGIPEGLRQALSDWVVNAADEASAWLDGMRGASAPAVPLVRSKGGHPCCPRDHWKLGRCLPMDRVLTDGGGWACPGIRPDKSGACGFTLPPDSQPVPFTPTTEGESR